MNLGTTDFQILYMSNNHYKYMKPLINIIFEFDLYKTLNRENNNVV